MGESRRRAPAPRRRRRQRTSSLLPLWEKVAIGGLWPPFFNRTPMLCIGYAKSVPDEGLHSIDRPEPLTRLRFAKPPSPTRGEGKKSGLVTHDDLYKPLFLHERRGIGNAGA